MTYDTEPWIIITHRSKNSAFRERFVRAGKLLDISLLVGNCMLHIIVTGYFATVINRSRNALVFGSNTPFYYGLLPYLHEDVHCVDLIHAFGGGLETISLPYVERLNRRIVITRKTFDDLNELYSLHGLSPKLAERIDIVENKVAVPAVPLRKVENEKLRVLYVGRGSEEKRVHLVGKIARFCHDKGLPVGFTLVGDVTSSVCVDDRQYCRFAGEIHNAEQIDELYRESDLLLLTSNREGFPMVIMEAMAYGVVPVTTDVGGIRYHVRNGENGFLVANSVNEGEIVVNIAALIEQMHRDRGLLCRLSGTAYWYAVDHFKGDNFDRYYRSLFTVTQS